jgi:hypothetical protein
MSEETPIEDLLEALPADWDANSTRRDTGMLGVTVINWRTLQHDAAPAAWKELGEWVDWFTRRYSIPARKIPPCWYQHGALVEELSALHTAWLVSFDTMDAGYGPIGWHERLAATLPRLTTWYNGECQTGHTPLTTPSRTTPDDTDVWNNWITETHCG